MRTGLLAAALLFAATRAPAAEPPPPVVFQVQPVGQLLDSLRSAADVIGGPRGVKAVDALVKELYGEKGLEGLDLNRPIVGYVVLAPKLKDVAVVIAFPVTDEKEFLALCDRANNEKVKPDEKDKELYHVPSIDPRYRVMMRFSDQHAYLACGADPARHLDPKGLVPAAKLYDPAERAVAAGRIDFDRIPLGVKLAAPAIFRELRDAVLGGGGFGIGKQEMEVLKPAFAELDKLAARYAQLAAGAEVLTARLLLDAKAGNFVAEATLTAKPNSRLAGLIADHKPAPSRLAPVADHPDTVAAVHARAPLFAPELRSAVALGLEAAGKEKVKQTPEADKALTDELFGGLARTAKNKDWDVAVALRGPDKDGWYTLVAASAFDDATRLGKETIEVWKKSTPKDQQDRMKWDADSFGKVGIHTYHFETGGFIDFTRVLGGEKCYGAFAFAPDAVVGAIGPDPVAAVKEVLAAKPAPAKAMAFVVNPARAAKVFEKAAGADDEKAAELANLLGREDKLVPAVSVEVTGGKELRATFTLNLRLFPRLVFKDAIDRANREPRPRPDDKK